MWIILGKVALAITMSVISAIAYRYTVMRMNAMFGPVDPLGNPA